MQHAARPQDARERAQAGILDEAAFPVPTFRPWIRIKQIDARKACRRQPCRQRGGVAGE
jgi:hypothetical protein